MEHLSIYNSGVSVSFCFKNIFIGKIYNPLNNEIALPLRQSILQICNVKD